MRLSSDPPGARAEPWSQRSWIASPILVALVLVATSGLVATAADEGREPTRMAPGGVLDLAEGGFLAGTLDPCPEVGSGSRTTLLWRSPQFDQPFEFRLDEIAGLRCAPPAQPSVAGRWLVNLRGGDTLSGDLEAIDADTITLAVGSADGGRRLRIDRGEVESVCRRGAGGGSFIGPGGLVGWRQAPQGSWREEAGRILSASRGAAVSRDIAAPVRARYDLVFTWKQPPEFRLAVNAAAEPARDGSWLEMTRSATGEAALMIVRRGPRAAALEPVAIKPAGDWLRVVLFVDRQQGRLAALVPGADGRVDAAEKPADIVLPPAAGDAASNLLRLTLTSGDLCLESLRVTAWNTPEPVLDEAAGTVIAARSGRITDASVEAFDAAADTFVLRRGGRSEPLAADTVDEIAFPAEPQAAAAAPRAADPAVRVLAVDGGMLSGDLVKVDAAGVWLRRRGVDGPLQVPFAAILAVKSLRTAAAPLELPGRIGRLLTAGADMRGCLVGVADGGAAIAWRPLGSLSASPFAAGDGRFAAQVEYVDSRKPPAVEELGGIGGMVNRNPDGQFIVVMLVEEGAAARDGRLQSGDQILAVAPAERSRFVETRDLDTETVTSLLRGRVGSLVRLKVAGRDGGRPMEIDLRRGPISVSGGRLLQDALDTHARLAADQAPAAADAVTFPAIVILRDGDVAACRVDAITADGVRLFTPLAIDPAEPVVVPERLVKAIELKPDAASLTIDRQRVDRLLTVPRMQRSRPPTHLLRLVDGDYLRGRLLALDATHVRFELVERIKDLPRDDVARIIWLHPEGPAGQEQAAGPAGRESAEPQAAEAKPATGPRSTALPVQAVWGNGRRVGFMADGLLEKSLRGRSGPLGAIGVAIGELDSLRFGAAIGEDGGERPYAGWILRPAPEPRPAAEASAPGAGPAS